MKGEENARIRVYPDGSGSVCATVGNIRRGKKGAKPRSPWRNAVEMPVPRETEQSAAERRDPGRSGGERHKAANTERARRRARAAVKELALCNQFEWFVTLTLDKEKIDRYDPAVVIRRASQWLSNAVRRRGLRYVLIPEHHKDGAIHFHGFMSGDLGAEWSGRRDKGGHEIYNLTAWTFGFSTAIRPYAGKKVFDTPQYGTEYRAAVAYCTKYISKQAEKIGGRWYYSGGDLKRPEVRYCDVEPSLLQDMGAYEFHPRGAGRAFWLMDLPKGVVSVLTDNKPAHKSGLHFEDSHPQPAEGWRVPTGRGFALALALCLGLEDWQQMRIGDDTD